MNDSFERTDENAPGIRCAGLVKTVTLFLIAGSLQHSAEAM